MAYLGSAGVAWAATALVAGGGAGVAAVGAWQHAGLAAGGFGQTLATVADTATAMQVARQHLVTDQAAGDVLQVAGDVAALLRRRGG